MLARVDRIVPAVGPPVDLSATSLRRWRSPSPSADLHRKQVAGGRGSARDSPCSNRRTRQLLAIAQALGIKTTARAAKATLIDKILETTARPGGSERAAPAPAAVAEPPSSDGAHGAAGAGARRRRPTDDEHPPLRLQPAAGRRRRGRLREPRGRSLGPDGEPLADWEIELHHGRRRRRSPPTRRPAARPTPAGDRPPSRPRPPATPTATTGGEDEAARRRRREPQQPPSPSAPQQEPRRRPARRSDRVRSGRPRPQQRRDRQRRDRAAPIAATAATAAEPISQEPVKVAGYLDLRDEGYGFLRVNGYLASRDDAYIPVKLTRQYGLRKGDHVTGLSRPAGRNEKNPALLEIHTVNGGDPEKAQRPPPLRGPHRAVPRRASCGSRTRATRTT